MAHGADPDLAKAAEEALEALEFNSGGSSDSMFDINIRRPGENDEADDGAAAEYESEYDGEDGEIYEYGDDDVDWLSDEISDE